MTGTLSRKRSHPVFIIATDSVSRIIIISIIINIIINIIITLSLIVAPTLTFPSTLLLIATSCALCHFQIVQEHKNRVEVQWNNLNFPLFLRKILQTSRLSLAFVALKLIQNYMKPIIIVELIQSNP